jgi:outer membrane protein assembly factor BamB
VLRHHNHANRDGVYVDPVFTKTAVATLHADTTFASPTYDASVYAQPLYLAGNGTVPDVVIVATTQNHVIAFHAGTGAVVWDQTFGAPVPRSSLCGQAINPSGIIGTPVIDEVTRTIYFNAMTLSGSTPADLVYALDANTGVAKSGWPIDLNARATANARSFVSAMHNQRGALALVSGRVLVPLGGHGGDCGDYRGWVISIAANDPTELTTFATRALGGGIWAPSGLASDGTSIYFATGNTMGMINNPFSHPDMYGDGETVFKLPPNLGRVNDTTEYFVPTDWSAMDDRDDDIGGTGTLVVDVPGATPSKLLVQLGKDGKAYLIDRDTMGGQSAPLSAPTVANGPIINSAAWYRTAMGTYVVFRGTGAGCPSGQSGSMTAIRITAAAPPVASVAWCGGAASNKSPAVTMTDASGANAMVWLIGNDAKLRAHDGDTGAVVFNGGATADTMTATAQFQTPIIANGRVFAASNTRAYAFRP